MILFPRFFTTFKCTNHLYYITGSSSSNHVNNVRPYMEIGLRNRLLQVSLFCLSPPQRPLCVVGRSGEKEKESAGGMMERGKRGRKRGSRLSLFPSFPARFLFFDHCYFNWDTLRKLLRRRQLFCNKLGERQRARFPYCPLAKFWTNVILASQAGLF